MNNILGRVFRAICFLGGIFCLAFALIPYSMYGIFNEGVWALSVLAGASLLCWFLMVGLKQRPKNWFMKFLGFMKVLLSICLSIFLVAEIFLSVAMVWAATSNSPDYDTPQTVIILGCLTINGEPSLMLSRRIDAAYEVLQNNSDAVAVVTGGYSPNESLTQAEISKNRLVSMGIDADRIFTEKNSEDTDENLKYSAEIIEANNLSNNVVIATDGFHQLRSALYAKMYGLSPTAVSSCTPWGLLPSYWIREQGGIVEIFLKEKSQSSKVAKMALQILTSI